LDVKPIGDKPVRMEKRKSPARREEGSGFHDILEKDSRESGVQRVKKLFDAIEKAAGDLSESPGEASLKEYRRRIKAFMDEVLSGSREIRLIPRPGVFDDPYMIVKVIDEKLDQLAQLVIADEVERGEMTRVIEDIKGILVDLYR
jgi:uncharacterized protein